MSILTNSPDLEGFETVHSGPHTVLIRSDWRDALLEDLLADFSRLAAEERRVYRHGRVEHFSYEPRGAPGRVFVRHAVRGGLLGALLGGLHLGVARPLRELRAAAAARRAGVSVPEPLAVRATRVGGLFWRFTLVSSEIHGASNLLALAPTLPPARKHEALVRLADELRHLHSAGIYHADLTVKNILLSGTGIHIIDLDKARLSRARRESLDTMNLARLNRSVEKTLGKSTCVTRTDKLRFLLRYLGGRERLRELARDCTSGLWFHRLWWAMSGQA
jgi:tRNA A-37 threonylcarbamoyl transferase component Bud32